MTCFTIDTNKKINENENNYHYSIKEIFYYNLDQLNLRVFYFFF